MRTINILCMVIAFVASACNLLSDNHNTIEPFLDSSVDKVDVTITGSITHFTIEGGGYAVMDESGKRYEAINLPERFCIDGLKVVVEAKYRNDLGSYIMIGPIIQIRSIRQR